MRHYRLPIGYLPDLPCCTVAHGTITLPFPIRLNEARRLVFLATVARARSAQETGPLLGRSYTWVCHAWRGYKLPVAEQRASPLIQQLQIEQPTLTRILEMARDSPCALCHQIAALLADMVVLPLPVRFDEARRALLFAVLHRVNNERSRAAATLGVSRRTIYQWCEWYGIPLRRKPCHVEGTSLQPASQRGGPGRQVGPLRRR